MAILRLVAEGVGPFDKLDVDFGDGKGNPHLGPHIFAGVNGSGKSTVLRTIAWCMGAHPTWGFDLEGWKHFSHGYPDNPTGRAFLAIQPKPGLVWCIACGWGDSDKDREKLFDWAKPLAHDQQATEFDPREDPRIQDQGCTWLEFRSPANRSTGAVYIGCAYRPTPVLRSAGNVDVTRKLNYSMEGALSFGGAMADAVPPWLVGLYSRRAIALQDRRSAQEYSRAIEEIEVGLSDIFGVDLRIEVKPELLEPRVVVDGVSQDFSQLPDGVRATLGWVCDLYMRRENIVKWDPELRNKKPVILLIDEIDAHLHPKWQRTVLPSIRRALPDVQIIVSTHSPFVISSSRDAYLHLLKLEHWGTARLKKAEKAPVGDSILSTVEGIFDIESRFADVDTERELDDWYQLKRKQAATTLSTEDAKRLKQLTKILSGLGDEVGALVGAADAISAISLERRLTKQSKRRQNS